MRIQTVTPQDRLEWGLLIGLVAIILGWYAWYLRAGVTWADDWATYVQDALNILHGRRYSTTGYIFNPQTDIGPTAYPPVYPLMLAVPIAIWGDAAGSSQRRISSSSPPGSATQPAVGMPTFTCRKIALPSPGVRAVLYPMTAP